MGKMNISPAAIGALMGSLSRHVNNLPRVHSFLRQNSASGDSACNDELDSAFECIGTADSAGFTACAVCTATIASGINWDADDICAEWAREEEADAGWCTAAEACSKTCEAVLMGTSETCKSEWDAVGTCEGISAEEAEKEVDSTDVDKMCPDLCTTSSVGFMIAMN